MAILVKAGESKSYQPAPAGVHQAVCVDVIDKGLLEVTYAGETKIQHKIVIAWQIDELRDDGKRYLLFKRYTASLHEKANLRKDLQSWRGRAFTSDEERGFDVESIIAANCLVNVQHNIVGDKTYANVVAVMPMHKGMTKIAPLDYVREKDQQQAPADSVEHSQPITEDDIPFAWLLPLVLPMTGVIGLGMLFA